MRRGRSVRGVVSWEVGLHVGLVYSMFFYGFAAEVVD